MKTPVNTPAQVDAPISRTELSLRKTVDLTIDRSSWTGSPAEYRHAFPRALGKSGTTEVDVFGSLVLVGILTVPRRAVACSLASYWAHLRYCAAIDYARDDLRLLPEWDELDSHQKTILSDDWGVGFTTHWLSGRLHFRGFCDGRYFIERLNGLGVAHVEQGPEKRGPYKCPDFIFEDISGRLHIVECKGNQQGWSELQNQLNKGIGQKRNILFRDETKHVAQRIVGGLYVAPFGARQRSSLTIADPAPEGEIMATITAEATPFLRDTVARDSLARQFELVGSPEMAITIRAHPEERQRYSYNVPEMLGMLETRAQRLPGMDERWIGRVVDMPFPVRVDTSGGSFGGVRLMHAVDRGFLRGLREFDPTAKTPGNAFELADSLNLPWRSEESPHSASLNHGGAFLSTISLVE
jgi:hypothetical protein